MERKSFAFEATEVDMEQGVVKGMCAVMGNIDDGDDRIPYGSARKTIAERGLRIKGGWQHDLSMPFARTTEIREVPREELPAKILERAPDATGGIFVAGKVSMNSLNRDRLQLVKDGLVDEMSIGYQPVQEKFVKAVDGRMIRELSEIKLFEWSLVTLGMNPAAQVTEAKRAKAAVDGAWDGPAQIAALDPGSDLRAICAVVEGDGSKKSDYHLPHHLASDDHAVVKAGVVAAGNSLMGARGGYKGPDANKAKVHLQAHYHALDMKAPWEKAAQMSEHKAEDEAGDISLAQQAIDIVNKLVAAESGELAGDADEADGIQDLLTIRALLIAFATGEASEGMGYMSATVGSTKAGRRNSSGDTQMIKAAHDHLHAVLGIPDHDMNGKSDAEDQTDGGADEITENPPAKALEWRGRLAIHEANASRLRLMEVAG